MASFIGDPQLVAAVEEAAQRAEEAQKSKQCVNCGHYVFFFEADQAVTEGHCYSEMGAREVAISSCCEYCFDNLFGEDDE